MVKSRSGRREEGGGRWEGGKEKRREGGLEGGEV